ncbi:juvenile hormone esterase-like [Malaya genurostris]|uniref:juvenile hormone esterase-like n=1 Tax=Malaya genurostris TaxID=325434 RepID=UPI0026F3BD77|nr:juvenile hormone esterase-like [Malaya genurostris]
MITFGVYNHVFKIALSYIKHFFLNLIIRCWPGIERPIVELRQGKVQGVTDKLPNGRKYHFFKGIPYAKPPIGELRFRSPEPLKRFNKPVLNCSSDKGFIKQSLAIFDWPVIGTEDGLYLNVYTPSLPVAGPRKFPVMVYIHGGGFRYGTASAAIYDPKYLIQQDVVVVLMFYRLGPLGFLCLPDAGISGNAGLKDQRLALKWVHENIYLFGGDAENVTLFGQSAGSWSTYLHYLSPNSRKYFHRVICQSGDSCTDYAFQVDPEEKARALARMLGYTGNSDQEVLATLMKASSTTLLNLQYDVLSPQEQSCPHRFLFRPVIERECSEDSIITQTPEEILKRFDTIRMPIISGYTSAEGALSLFLSKNRINEYNQHPEWLVPRFLNSLQDDDRRILGNQVKQFYIGNKELGWNTLDETCDLMADLTFVTSNTLSAEWIAKYQPNVHHYHYLFDYSGRCNIMKMMISDSIIGAAHGDDIFYMFSPSLLPDLPDDSEECAVRNIYVRLFTNFAKYGNPTPDESILGFKWTAVTPLNRDSFSFDLDSLRINQSPEMVRNVCHKRKEFWRKLIKRHSNML